MGYYEWFDPHQRIESLTRVAQSAREEGRRDVLRTLEADHRGYFRHTMEDAIRRCAREISEKVFKPEMSRDYQDAERQRKLQDVMVRGIMDTVPLSTAFTVGEMDLRLRSPVYSERDARNPMIDVEVRTVRPFRYTVRAAMKPF